MLVSFVREPHKTFRNIPFLRVFSQIVGVFLTQILGQLWNILA